MLDPARLALSAESRDLQVLGHRRDAKPVAFLVTFGRGSQDLVVPLVEGRTRVGRRDCGDQGSWPNPHAIEQAQWLVECRARTASICDAASTNLSVLLPAESLPLGLAHDQMGHLGIETLNGARWLTHPNTLVDGKLVFAPTWYELHEGDVLRSCYATFVFGWLT